MVGRALATLTGCVALFAEPTAAAAYAELQRPNAGNWASYESLVFLGTVLVPVESLVLCRAMCANSLLSGAIENLERRGINRRLLALNPLLAVALLSGVLGAISAVLAVICSTGGWPTPSELAQSAWIVGLSGLAYGAIIGLLSKTKNSRLWLWVFVVFDFLLGGTTRAISLPFPRLHVHNLLGSTSLIDIPQRDSCIVLVVLALLAAGLTILSTDP